MPTRVGRDSEGTYARWGHRGKKYYFRAGDPMARRRAIRRANRQGAAVRASEWVGNASRERELSAVATVPTLRTKRNYRLDPSRTYSLRRQFMLDMRRRFVAVSQAVQQYVVVDDAFGLAARDKPNANKGDALATHAVSYAFATDTQKVLAFQKWIQQQVDDKILVVHGGEAGKPWTAKYVEAAYKKGAYRSYASKYRERAKEQPKWYGGTRGDFIRSAFYQPEMMSKVELLATRSYELLKGVTSQMSSEMNRVFASAIVEGKGAVATARALRETVTTLTNRRALAIARTEIVYAHAEGQLDGFAALGVGEVVAEVEWSTSGDGAVCEDCHAMEGTVYRIDEAHGLIPLHTNCRCAWTDAREKRAR